MAVAVKTPQGASHTGPLASPAILSLVGVAYLLASLAIVFKVLPEFWWKGWELAGMEKSVFVGGSLLALVGLAVTVGLLALGGRLLGPNPPAGIRAGVFVGFLGLLVAVLLARWASLWFEYWVVNNHIAENAGVGLAIAVGAGLVVLWLWIFTRPGTQQSVAQFEEMGWFHAKSYKSNQGQKVRRGTIFGLLLVVGAGIWTLLSNNTLAKGPRDWALNIPFTGRAAVEGTGDVGQFLAAEPESSMSAVRITWGGSDNLFKPGDVVSFANYKAAVDSILKSEPSLKEYLPLVEVNKPALFVPAVNETVIGKRLNALLAENYYPAGVRSQLVTRLNESPTWGDAAGDFYRQSDAQIRAGREPGAAFRLPAAVLLVDRAALRAANANADENSFVKVEFAGASDLKPGSIIPRADFDEAENKLKAEREKGRDRDLPTYRALYRAAGPLEYRQATLLPSVQFTVPLLLLVGSLWLAWRVVNMPAFADFLIATEAEMNKVSWASQRKLVQDTIVVLVTVVLMSVFLFGTDWMWKTVLSNDYVGVLHIPKETSQQNLSVDKKKY